MDNRRLAKYQIWVNGCCGILQLDHSAGLEANARRRDAGKVEWRRSAYKCQQEQQEMVQVDTKGENAILLLITKGERRRGILATLAAWCPQPTEPRVCNDWQSLVGQWHDTIAVDSKPKIIALEKAEYAGAGDAISLLKYFNFKAYSYSERHHHFPSLKQYSYSWRRSFGQVTNFHYDRN